MRPDTHRNLSRRERQIMDILYQRGRASAAEILAAMRRVLDTEHWLVEGAAGVAVAAFLKEEARYRGKTVVIVICGRNVSMRSAGGSHASIRPGLRP